MADYHWELSGKLSHLIYNPRGGIEGLLLDVDGIPAQFVSEPHLQTTLARCKPGQRLTLIGELRKPSPKGPSDHEVYDLKEIVGKAVSQQRTLKGTVVRLNYAKHGEPNGVVLDTGDFIHTKPDGLQKLGWKVGDKVQASGEAEPLKFGNAYVLDYFQE